MVDDEPTVRMLVADVLEELGYVAVEAGDGGDRAGACCSRTRASTCWSPTWACPAGMNGRQVADAARAARPDLKVLFITGYAENALVGNGQLEPGMQVMTKPFDVDALARRIRDLLAKA